MTKQAASKKQLLPEVDALLKPHKFFRKGTGWSYLHRPIADERLVWLLVFEFNSHGGLTFNISIGAAWEPSYFPPMRFPKDVSTYAMLGLNGVDKGENRFYVNKPNIFELIGNDLVPNHVLPYLKQYDTPERLLAVSPDPVLAEDIGEVDKAIELYTDKLWRYHNIGLSQGRKDTTTIYHGEMLRVYQEKLQNLLASIGRGHEFSDINMAAEIDAHLNDLDRLEKIKQKYGETRSSLKKREILKERIDYLERKRKETGTLPA